MDPPGALTYGLAMRPVAPLLALMLLTAPAFGHARLIKATPSAGAKVKNPKHVVLTFSESLEPAFSGALLMDGDGRNFTGAPVKVDRTVMTLTPDRLAPGRYRVNWHAVGSDGHRTEGEFGFTVVK